MMQAGNQIAKSEASGSPSWTYTYDNNNHMVGATEKSSGGTLLAQETFTYDVQGNLVQQAEYTSTSGTTTTTRFAVDASGTMWAELDGSNNLLSRYLTEMGTGQLLTRTVASGTNAGVSIYLTDNEGSVRGIVSWSGVMTDNLDYSGFGVVTESNSSVGDQFKYDGYHFVAVIGYYMVGARTYNPATGNWGQIDPASFTAGQSNLYQYVGNNPTDGTDPNGLWKITRDNRLPLAQAVSLPGDSFFSLGLQIGLNGRDFNKWITRNNNAPINTLLNGKQYINELNSTELLKGGIAVQIPNAISCYWIGAWKCRKTLSCLVF